MKELLANLRQLPEFRAVMDELRVKRPIVPVYRPAESIEDEEAYIRKFKHASAKREGFDLLWNALVGQPVE